MCLPIVVYQNIHWGTLQEIRGYGLGLLKDMDTWGALGSPRTTWREYVPRRGGVTNLCYWRVTLDCNAQCQYRYIGEGTTLGSMAG